MKRPDHTAADYVPPSRSLRTLSQASKGCRGCDLYRHATQTVFGEGAKGAQLFLIGEQPGDAEDREGHPFVGPAGGILDRALEEAGIDRTEVYVTNAVKHFKFLLRGKRRIHQKPGLLEVAACRPWLDRELETVKPRVIVCLGATAAGSVLGKGVRLTEDRGKPVLRPDGSVVIATFHPSYLLRMPDPKARERAYALFVSDLRAAHAAARRKRRSRAAERSDSRPPKT